MTYEKINLLRLFAFGLSVLSLLGQSMASGLVGNVQGILTIDGLGTANYTVPIELPKGIAGLSPELVLTYNSRGGNGILGKGFSLGGLSAITRTGATDYYDGFVDGVDFDSNDRFLLDGQRMINVGGTSYRTEIDGFDGISGDAANGFTVTRKSGSVYKYGQSADSKAYAFKFGQALSWAVNSIVDVNGNGISFSYNNDDDGHYIESIVYAGSACSVGFEYESRPDDAPAYLDGEAMQLKKRLLSISIRSGGILVRRYSFTYVTHGNESYLNSIGCDVLDHGSLESLPPTSFTYSEIDSGSSLNFQEIPYDSTYLGGHSHVLKGDFNGDGMDDVLAFEDLVNQWVGLSTGSGFTKHMLSEKNSIYPESDFGVGDFNGDGNDDFLCIWKYNKQMVALSNGDGTFDFINLQGDSSYYTTSVFKLGDFNGDGKTDILCVRGYDKIYTGISNGDGTFTYHKWNELFSIYDFSRFIIADFNGDYKDDVLVLSEYNNEQVAISNGDGGFVFFDLVQHFTLYDHNKFHVADFNGDGAVDLAAITWNDVDKIAISQNSLSGFEGFGFSSFPVEREGPYLQSNYYTSDINGDGKTDLIGNVDPDNAWVGINKGDGALIFHDIRPGISSGIASKKLGGDFNGDGKMDVVSLGMYTLVIDGLTVYYTDNYAGYSAGDGTFTYQDISDEIKVYSWSKVLVGDFNGDGADDVLGFCKYDDKWVACGSKNEWLLDTVVSGNGETETIAYKSLLEADYIKETGSAYPIADYLGPMYVVDSIATDSPGFGISTAAYAYSGARMHEKGRGFLGFHIVDSYNDRTKIRTVEMFDQNFPYIGSSIRKQTYYNEMLVEQVDHQYTHKSFESGTVYFPYVEQSVVQDKLAGTTNTTDFAYDDNGNPTRVFTDHGDGSSEETLFPSYIVKNSVHVPESMVATFARSNTPNIVKTEAYTYHDSSRLWTRTVEPNHATLSLTSTYTYDGFGNLASETVSGASFDTRVVASNTYDTATGRHLEESRNALGHLTTYSQFDVATGLPKLMTDPNELETQWQYDGLGRMLHETRPDQTTTTVSYTWDATSFLVDTGYESQTQQAYYKKTVAVDGSHPVMVYHDYRGREIRTQTLSADGTRNIFKDTGYNSQGQVFGVSEPYFEGEPQYWNASQYDAQKRLQYAIQPDGTITEYAYNGLVTQMIEDSDHRTTGEMPKNQTTTITTDAQRIMLSVKDNMDNTISYQYYADGNLWKTIDPALNETVLEYNVHGSKIRQIDLDMGTWTYHHNALGELESQTNANLQVATMEYDTLGRMETRISPEGTASWVYDGTGEGCKIGALRREQMLDAGGVLINRKSYAYDHLGRPMLELMNHDNKWFYTTLRYDAYSRVEHTDWFWRPQEIVDSGDDLSPDWNTFSMEYGYDTISGAMLSITDGTGHEWWACTLADYDEHGRITGSEYGNGSINGHVFDPATGLMVFSNSQFPGAPTPDIMDHEYNFDRIGNLEYRKDLKNGLQEDFGYDGLNRLTGVDDASSFVQYNALGNIESKADVGTYIYGQNGAGPHAVTSADGVAYGYDDCGNMVSRTEGTNISSTTWASFNKPWRIERGASSSEFAYDANHRRITQHVDSGGTLKKKIYIGTRMEQEENPDGQGGWTNTLTRIFVSTPSGVIGIEERTPQTTVRKYLHRDHLGSIVAVSGEAAELLAEVSFDAWGKQRNATDWTASTSNLTTAISADRGFTGHEMLDNVNLVHMNGRIYDQTLGRFLSADPTIPYADNLQSYNRYSYVQNNPLSRTDPSGFTDKDEKKKKEHKAKSAADSKKAEGKNTAGSQSVPSGETGRGMTTDGKTKDYRGSAAGFFNSDIYGYASEWKTGLAEGAYEGYLAGKQLLTTNPLDTIKGIPSGLKQGWKNTKQYWGDVWNGTGDPDATARTVGKWTFNAEAAVVTGAGAKALKQKLAPKNVVPNRMARVVAGDGPYPTLGAPGRADVFVTAADDIAGMNARQISQRLTIDPSKRFTVIEFNTPSSGVASPINRLDKGFIGGGWTKGGAREFVIPNQPIPADAAMRIVQ
ncbi:MAG: VCBS repeat-containing protein [Verrucomicrobia bacterium]|nr:VCBS repeat-containing protein [Verrucomicrobiota bacterium]